MRAKDGALHSVGSFPVIVVPAPEALQDGVVCVGLGLRMIGIVAMFPFFSHHQNRQQITSEKRTAIRLRSAALEYLKLGVAAKLSSKSTARKMAQPDSFPLTIAPRHFPRLRNNSALYCSLWPLGTLSDFHAAPFQCFARYTIFPT